MNTEILEFLRERSGRVFSVKEVSREVDRDRYERDQTWASSSLKGLCAKGLIEAINGCYWVPEKEDKNSAREENEQTEEEPVEAQPEPSQTQQIASGDEP